jgi:hypothetical protein
MIEGLSLVDVHPMVAHDDDEADHPVRISVSSSVSPTSHEWIARISLDDNLAAHCDADQIDLRVDDALGADGQVLWLDPRGLLALYHDQLIWFPTEDHPMPTFRMTWRSPFHVWVTQTSKSSSQAKSAPKRKRPKAKKRPKRSRARRK